MYPIVGHKAEGSRFWDIDGNEYVDITMGFGTLLCGHTPSFIQQAHQEQIRRGIQLGPQSEFAGENSALISEMTGVDRVAFCNTGTEAIMTALRLARAYTKRHKVVHFSNSYHGAFDPVFGVGNNDHPNAMAPTIGFSPNLLADSLILDYGSPESLEIIAGHSQELAAVLVEPVQARRPDLQPGEFLNELREFTAANDIPLIFDEVLLGFRIGLGGAQAYFDIKADIVTYGKIVGGGFPIGVVAGKSQYLDAIDGGMWDFGDSSRPSAEKTLFVGTFNKNPLGMASALAVLRHLKEQGPTLQETLNRKTTTFARNLNTFFEKERYPLRIIHFGSLFRFDFHRVNSTLFFYQMIEKGVYIWEGRNCFFSTAHTDEDFEFVSQVIEDTVAELREGGVFPAA